MCWWSLNKEKGKKREKEGPKGPYVERKKKRKERERRRGKEERELLNGLEFNRGDLRYRYSIFVLYTVRAQRARA